MKKYIIMRKNAENETAIVNSLPRKRGYEFTTITSAIKEVHPGKPILAKRKK
jgi:hypothetical protein